MVMSTAKIERDDPRLTAYVLGESDDPEVAEAIAQDAALRAEVDAIRAAAGLLTDAFGREPELGLSEEQREAVLGEGATGTPGIDETVSLGDAAGEEAVASPEVGPTRQRGRVLRFPSPREHWRPYAVAAGFAILLGWAAGSGVFARMQFTVPILWIESVRQSDVQADTNIPMPIPLTLKEVLFGVKQWDAVASRSPFDQEGTAQSIAHMKYALGVNRRGLAALIPADQLGQSSAQVAVPPELTSEPPSLALADTIQEAEQGMAPIPTPVAPAPRAGGGPQPTPETGGGGTQSVATSATRKIVKNADMAIEVERVDTAINQITGAAAQLGGYVLEVRSDYQQDTANGATVSVAVPVDNFEAMLQRVRETATKLVSEQASGRDATKEYVDLQSQIANLEATQARIRQFLDQAKSVDEAMKVNAQLTDIEGQISQLKGQLQFLAQRAAYSTVNVTLQQVPPKVTPTPTATPTPAPTPVAWSPGDTARTSFGQLSGVLKSLTNVAIWLAIVPLPLVLPFVAAWWVVDRRRRHPAPVAADGPQESGVSGS
jgi:hypothetical protein